jgi:RNA polymerase sigma-70 factor (ECF subfamily)
MRPRREHLRVLANTLTVGEEKKLMTTGSPSQSIDDLLDHREWTRQLARTLVWDEAQADDLAQNVFLAALQRPPKTDRPLRPWLAAVVRNLRAKHFLSERRRKVRDAEAASTGAPADHASSEELLGRSEAERMLATLIAELDEPFRQTVLMRYFEERTAADIAQQLGVPAGTVRWRLKAALDELRRRLDARDEAKRQPWRAILGPFAASGAAGLRHLAPIAPVVSSHLPLALGGLLALANAVTLWAAPRAAAMPPLTTVSVAATAAPSGTLEPQAAVRVLAAAPAPVPARPRRLAQAALPQERPARKHSWAVPGDRPTIQAAIDAAGPGDEIRIAAGRHCGARVTKRLDIVGAPGATVVGCAGSPALPGGLRIGLMLAGEHARSRASGTHITGLTFDGRGVSDTELSALAFGVFARFADDVIVSRNVFEGTVQAVTNTAGDRWVVTSNKIEELRAFTCAGACGGGVAIAMQAYAAEGGLPGGSLNPANRPKDNTVADNEVTGRLPDGLDAFSMVGVLVRGADRTVVSRNRVTIPANPNGRAAGEGITVSSVMPHDDAVVPGPRDTVVEENDGRGSQLAVLIESHGVPANAGLELRDNAGVVTHDSVDQ